MEKIRDPQQQIKANFPDFPGKPGSFNDCVDYFKGRFKSLSKTPGKEIYMHVTTAVEKENIKVVSSYIIRRLSLGHGGLSRHDCQSHAGGHGDSIGEGARVRCGGRPIGCE